MLTEPRYQFPLAEPFTKTDAAGERPGVIRPFGLKYAVVPAGEAHVDLPSLSYDSHRQIAVALVSGKTVPAMKHTSTHTKTSTGNGSGPDSDTDATGR